MRPHAENTAVLLSSGSRGWVHAWSVHPRGGLLGGFVGARSDGESVLSMVTDKENTLLITGDSRGYVQVGSCFVAVVQAYFKHLHVRVFEKNEV